MPLVCMCEYIRVLAAKGSTERESEYILYIVARYILLPLYSKRGDFFAKINPYSRALTAACCCC